MEANKTVNDELRSQKSTNMLIGYVLALAAMFVAFEYTQREVKVVEEDKIYDFRMEEDMMASGLMCCSTYSTILRNSSRGIVVWE